jgi:hypothetical protein
VLKLHTAFSYRSVIELDLEETHYTIAKRVAQIKRRSAKRRQKKVSPEIGDSKSSMSARHDEIFKLIVKFVEVGFFDRHESAILVVAKDCAVRHIFSRPFPIFLSPAPLRSLFDPVDQVSVLHFQKVLVPNSDMKVLLVERLVYVSTVDICDKQERPINVVCNNELSSWWERCELEEGRIKVVPLRIRWPIRMVHRYQRAARRAQIPGCSKISIEPSFQSVSRAGENHFFCPSVKVVSMLLTEC